MRLPPNGGSPGLAGCAACDPGHGTIAVTEAPSQEDVTSERPMRVGAGVGRDVELGMREFFGPGVLAGEGGSASRSPPSPSHGADDRHAGAPVRCPRCFRAVK